jgi:UDP-4-amino-4,6-dideoxy-N-acetyl-beta-L-altrosamine N-acetyltransferase
MRLRLCNFTTLDEPQKKMILTWRNHTNVKAYMYHTNDISETEHFCFVKALETREDRCYFLVQNEGIDIGVIDFNDISPSSAIMGLYANPTLHQKGIGSLLMEAIVIYAFETLKVHILKAEVFENNDKAKALYEKFGFCEKGRKMVNKKEVICMELANEHR